LRIVYLNPVGKLGGAEALLLDLLASMKQLRPDWALELILPEHGLVADRASALGVTVHVIEMPRAMTRLRDYGSGSPGGACALAWRILRALPGGLVYCRRLRHKIRQLKPDVLHSNGFKTHLLSIWSRPTGTPVLWHIHDFVGRRPLMARVLPRLARRCSAAIANSEQVRKDLRKLCPNLPVTTLFNAVDLDEFAPVGTVCDLDLLSGLPEPGNIIRVGLLATMARWKGHAVFLEALSRVSSSVPLRAYLIGGAIYKSDDSQWQVEELQALAARLGLAGRIGFTGFVMRPAGAIRALDIVVHASTGPEPFGLAIAEAMACGKAVIASSQGGPEEFLRHDVNGLTHRAGDADDLARMIERLLGDPALRTRLGLAARDSAVHLFDRRRLAAEMIPVYESLRIGGHVNPRAWAVGAGAATK
jgi:glycosyltransferase involved in cell wall biosynthesis